MKTRNIFAFAMGFILYLAFHLSLSSYGCYYAHPIMNELIMKLFTNERNNDKSSDYELLLKDGELTGLAVTNYGYISQTTGESMVSKTPWDWIIHGGTSADQPETFAALRHFYDPLALSGERCLTDRSSIIEVYVTNPHIDAIEWCLGDSPKGADNKYSWEKGKQAVIDALMTTDAARRKELMAKAWRCLGETLHNTADMGIPSHVRNDSHGAFMQFGDASVFGSPDPYEERFDPNWTNIYGCLDIDQPYADFLGSAKTARTINEQLAKFTNAFFFSSETISGTGIDPLNKQKSYPFPKLEDLNYSKSDFTYYKTFPNGKTVKMCKDFRYLSKNYRGYPYLDYECIQSQAAVVLPYIIQSGKKVFELFIPDLRITFKPNTDGHTVEGSIRHYPTDEYPDEILYNGPIKIKWQNREVDVDCKNGKFKEYLLERPVSDFNAYIDCGGIKYKYKNEPSKLNEYTNWLFNVTVNVYENDGKVYNHMFDGADLTKNIVWNGNSFQGSWDTTGIHEDKTEHIKRLNINLEADETGQKIKQIIIDGYYFDSYKQHGDDHFNSDEATMHLTLKPVKNDIILADSVGKDSDGNMIPYKYMMLKFDNFTDNISSFTLTHKIKEPIYDNDYKFKEWSIKDLYYTGFDTKSGSMIVLMLIKQ